MAHINGDSFDEEQAATHFQRGERELRGAAAEERRAYDDDPRASSALLDQQVQQEEEKENSKCIAIYIPPSIHYSSLAASLSWKKQSLPVEEAAPMKWKLVAALTSSNEMGGG
jgi:hypothetical protein